MHRTPRLLLGVSMTLVIALGAWAVLRSGAAAAPKSIASAESSQDSNNSPNPLFGAAFWKHWGDGRAELAGYDLTFPRYGETRKGVAVTVFVTETFSNSLRVKSDPGKHPASDEFPVMKLNLIQDFQTGVYDYNLLTSAFVTLSPVNGRPAGSPTKVSFSSQEWCGGAYGQVLFDHGSARLTSHSYFDGEADGQRVLTVPPEALAADAVLLWTRGFAAPIVAPGERREVACVGSLQTSRLTHRPVEVGRATLGRDTAATRVTVPAGRFEVERRTVQIAGGPLWTILVERAEPHRIIRWETSEGERAELLGSDRLPYWTLHGKTDEGLLSKLGLTRRPDRTP